MQANRRFSRATPLEDAIDMTPLIDVVFVVLILFILIAPMLDIDQISLASAPKKENANKVVPGEDHPLVIHVQSDNTILVNKRKVDQKNLRAIFSTLHSRKPQLIPQLYQDKKAFFGTYQTVKNALEEAGYEKLDIVLDPSS